MYFIKWWYTDGLIDQWQKTKSIINHNVNKYYLSILYTNLNAPLFGRDSLFEKFLAIIIRRVHFIIIFLLFLIDSFGRLLILTLWISLPLLTVFYLINLLF